MSTGAELKFEPKDLWIQMLVASAPEQKLNVEDLLRRYDVKITVAADAPGARLSANRGRITFDNKTMRVYWLLGFAGWRVLECYAPAIVASLLGHGSVEECLKQDSDLAEVESKFFDRVYAAKSLLLTGSADDIEWPNDLPAPGAAIGTMSHENRATFDLIVISTAFAFLHELRHVTFFVDGAPPSRPDEELACDAWAREFLTTRVGEYARTSGEPYDDVLRKRSIASALGVFILYESSERWGDSGNELYPPLADRMDAALRATPLPAHDKFWLFYAAVLVAILRRRNIFPKLTSSTPMAYCHELTEQIRRTS